MNRERKFILMRQFPWMFKRELRELANEYREEITPFYSSEPEKESKYDYTLIDVVAAAFDEKFLEKMERQYGIFFRVDDKTPDALKHNPRFLDYMAQHHPNYITNFPNEMITDEHIRLYEDFLKSDYYFITSMEIPFRLTESKFIIDKYLEAIERPETYSKEEYYANLLNSCRDKKEKVDYVLNKLGDRFYTEILNDELYEHLNYEFQCDEKIIDCIMEQNILNYDLVPEEKRDYARKFIIDRIERDEIESLNLGRYHFTKDIYKDKEIFFALLKKEMSKRTNEEVDMEYLRTHSCYNYKISTLLQLFLTNFDPDLENMSTEDKYNIYKILKINRKDGYNNYNIYGLYKSKDLLSFMIDRHESIDFSDFNSIELDDDTVLKIFNYQIDSVKDENYIVGFSNFSVFANAFRSKDVLNGVLNKILSLDDIKVINNIAPYITNFKTEAFDEENLKLLFQVFDKYENMKNMVLGNYLLSEDLLGKLLKLNRADLTSIFSVAAYNTDNIVLALKLSDMHNLFNTVTDHLKIESIINNLIPEEVDEVLENAINNKNVLVLLSLYRNKNLGTYDSPKFEEYRDKFNEIISSTDIPKEVIDKILNGERKAVNAEYVTNDATKYFFMNFGDITSKYESEALCSYPVPLLEKINRKQFVSILKSLENIDAPCFPTITALNMYLTFGFARCKDILNPNEDKNYGTVSGSKLHSMFGKLNTKDTTFVKDGNGYVPVINEELINTLFGKNYKVRNTPFRNYINGYKEYKEAMTSQTKRIEEDLTLTPEQKEAKLKTLEEQRSKYEADVNVFIQNLDVIFYNWDIIEEEFLKKKNKSKLDLKLNIGVINEITTMIKNKVNKPPLEPRDEPLERTDIFDYVGHDTQFTHNPSDAPQRAVTLSRMMDENKDKKFPHIDFSRGKLRLETFSPSDRDILTAGYKSHCCFRPNGNADDFGKDISLLTYCSTNEYGGGLKIVDEKGKYKMFTPILRNGNVLMLHSIETFGMSEEESKEVHEMLKEYAERVIKIAKEKGDKIDFVTITNLHYLDDKYVIGELIGDRRFNVYDRDNKFNGMYNNLASTSHMILAKSEGVTTDDVRYGYDIDISYESPKENYVININIDDKDELSFNKLDLLKIQYASLTRKKQELLKQGKKEEAYEIVEEMKKAKESYLSELKSVSKRNEGLDKYSIFSRVKPGIERIAKANDTLVPQDIRKVLMGRDWYIVVNSEGTIIGDTTNKENEEYERYFKMITESLPNSKSYKEGIKVPQSVAVVEEAKTK